MRKRMLSLLLTLCMAVTALPATALAEDGGGASAAVQAAQGGGNGTETVQIKDEISNKTVNVMRITQAGTYTFTSSSFENNGKLCCIEVAAPSGKVALELSGVSLDTSETGSGDAWKQGIPALAITGGCETVITLTGENTLTSGALCAGLQNGTHKLTIEGEGTLNATGGQGGAGIGGGQTGSGSNITIKGGTVTAGSTPNSWNRVIAAGIGGGYQGNGTGIAISDGTVTATGGAGAGIGGGGGQDNRGGEGSGITISGGTVTAIGAEGAGIGGGQRGDGHEITISGGTVTAKAHDGACIGGGQCADGYNIEITGGTITVADTQTWPAKSSADIGGGSGYDAGNAPGTGWDITIGDGVTFKDSAGTDVEKNSLAIGNSASGVPFLVIDKYGEQKYHYSAEEKLSDAITAGVTVKLLRNVELTDKDSITVSKGKDFTLDLNGFTVSLKGSGKGSLFDISGTLKIVDSSEGRTGTVKGFSATGNGSLTIEGGTFDADPSKYVNTQTHIVKRSGEPRNYLYTVIQKSDLTDGVYLQNPAGHLAKGYYVSSSDGEIWTVSKRVHSSGGSYPIYAIEVDKGIRNGEVTVSRRYARRGDTVTVTVKPDSGYVLGSLTVTGRDGGALGLTDKGDGTYTFTMPAGRVRVAAAFTAANPFADVPAGSYYADAVAWAVAKGVTTGTGPTTFSPDSPCTRAQAVTLLWRAAGSPAPKGSAVPFTDVPAGSYYADAVRWAVENGITTGTGPTTFSPDDACTRAQLVTLLWRYAKSPAADGGDRFADVPAGIYYEGAVKWAVGNGVTTGTGPTTFSPDDACTRAQAVTFLYRLMK